MYHRIAGLSCDPWQLAVSPACFDQQLRVIRQHWHPLPLHQLAQALTNGALPDRSVVLTFDDGYLDNFTQALPLLEQHQIPATFFITTNACAQQTPFWWDELQAIILTSSQLPERVSLTIAGEDLTCHLADEVTLTASLRQKHQSWIAAQGASTKRSDLYLQLWRRMKPLSHPDQQAVLTALRNVTGWEPEKPSGLVCMTPDHIRQVAADPLFGIGAHTLTHPALADHPADVQQGEISGSAAYLNALTPAPVRHFAYPYGSYTNATVAALQAHSFSAAVTTNEGLVTKHSPALQLNRYQVMNWNGDAFGKQLTRWFSNAQ